MNNLITLDDIYFKDVFTETSEGINIEVNKVSANCITSNNNKFNLDNEGNLQVNSIIVNQEGTWNDILLKVYPIGAIYLSVSDVNPGTLFGGTWVAWGNGRTLIGMGDNGMTNYTIVEAAGGSESHTHTSAAHNHTSAAHTHGLTEGYALLQIGANYIYYNERTVPQYTSNWRLQGSSNNSYNANLTVGTSLAGNTNSTTPSVTGTTTPANTGSADSRQPWITCYMWKRTA